MLSFRAGSIYTSIKRKRSYIEDMIHLLLSFRASSIYTSITNGYIEDMLSFRADSIYTSILNVVIWRTCSSLGQTVFIHQY